MNRPANPGQNVRHRNPNLVAGAGGDLGQIFASVRGWAKNSFAPVLKQDSSISITEVAPASFNFRAITGSSLV